MSPRCVCRAASRSVDDKLYRLHMATPDSATRDRSRKGTVLGSIERMFNMLTPKRRGSSTEGPRKARVRQTHQLVGFKLTMITK